MRIVQKTGTRGSLMYIQRLLAHRPELLDERLREAGALSSDARVRWVSPLQNDEWAEYRDAAFLDRLGRGDLAPALAEFWPSRGPQWDALGVSGNRLILVEAKAHVGELASSCGAKAKSSRDKITRALEATKTALGAPPSADWLTGYYQLANRLAHLEFLKARGADARLVLLQFTGNTGMPTSSTREAYDAAILDAFAHLGIDIATSRMLNSVLHIHVDVEEI